MANGEIWHELFVNTSPEQLYEAVATVKARRTGGQWGRGGNQRSAIASNFGSMIFVLPLRKSRRSSSVNLCAGISEKR